MITQEQYIEYKKLIEEYEQAEYQQANIDAMYCIPCQAFIAQECFCEGDEDDLGVYNEDEYGANCTCGAYQISKSGTMVHIGDCYCGAG